MNIIVSISIWVRKFCCFIISNEVSVHIVSTSNCCFNQGFLSLIRDFLTLRFDADCWDTFDTWKSVWVGELYELSDSHWELSVVIITVRWVATCFHSLSIHYSQKTIAYQNSCSHTSRVRLSFQFTKQMIGNDCASVRYNKFMVGWQKISAHRLLIHLISFTRLCISDHLLMLSRGRIDFPPYQWAFILIKSQNSILLKECVGWGMMLAIEREFFHSYGVLGRHWSETMSQIKFPKCHKVSTGRAGGNITLPDSWAKISTISDIGTLSLSLADEMSPLILWNPWEITQEFTV